MLSSSRTPGVHNTFFARHVFYVLLPILLLGGVLWLLQVDLSGVAASGKGLSDLWQSVGFGLLMALPLPLLSLFAHQEWWMTRSLTHQEIKRLMGTTYLKFWCAINLLLFVCGVAFYGIPQFFSSSALYLHCIAAIASILLGLLIVADDDFQRYLSLFLVGLIFVFILDPEFLSFVGPVWRLAVLSAFSCFQIFSWWRSGPDEANRSPRDRGIENGLFQSLDLGIASSFLRAPFVLRYQALARTTFLQYLLLVLGGGALISILFLFLFPEETVPLFTYLFFDLWVDVFTGEWTDFTRRNLFVAEGYSFRLLPWLCLGCIVAMVPHRLLWRSRREYLLTRSASLLSVNRANFLAQQTVYWGVVGLGCLFNMGLNVSALSLQMSFFCLLLFVSLSGFWSVFFGLILVAFGTVDPLGPLTLLISTPCWSTLGLWLLMLWLVVRGFFQPLSVTRWERFLKTGTYALLGGLLTLISMQHIPLLEFMYVRGQLPLYAQMNFSRALRDELWTGYTKPNDFFSQGVKHAYAPENVDNNQQLTRLYLAEIGGDSWRQRKDHFLDLQANPSPLRFAFYNPETPAYLQGLKYWQRYVSQPTHQPLVSYVQGHTLLALRQAQEAYEQTREYQDGLELAMIYRLLTYTEKAVAVYEQLQAKYPERQELATFKAATLKLRSASKSLRPQQKPDELAFAYSWKTYHGKVWKDISEGERLWRAKLMLVFVSTHADLKTHVAFFESRVSPASFMALQALVKDMERLLQELKRQHLSYGETGLLLYVYQRAAYGIALTDYPALVVFVREDAQKTFKD